MRTLKGGLAVALFLSRMAYALDTIPGWYAGLIVGGSKPPEIDFNVLTPVERHSGQSILTYSVLGNVGGQIGYRKKQFRVEGEFFYNNNPYKHLNIDGVDIPNEGAPATTIQQLSIQSKTVSNPFTFSGYTNTYAWMFNGFYDFYLPNYTEHFVPYVGLGLGVEEVVNYLEFFNNGSATQNSTSSQSSYKNVSNYFAGQAVVGLSYFVTDHSSFAFDFRYLSSFKRDAFIDIARLSQHRPQLYSVNFVFNSAF